MKIYLYIVAITCSIFGTKFLAAQADTTRYIIVLNTGSRLTGHILERNPPSYLKVEVSDSIIFIPWNDFSNYFPEVKKSTVKKSTVQKNEKQTEKQRQLNAQLDTWDTCFIILLSGDTAFGTTIAAGGSVIDQRKIKFGQRERGIMNFTADDLREVYLFKAPSDYRHYISAPDGMMNFFARIIVDGKCRLLYRKATINTGGVGMVGSGPFGTTMTPMPGQIKEVDQFYYQYKGEITKVHYETNTTLVTNFMERSAKVMKQDCPAIIEKIKTGEYTYSDIGTVVKEFNACIK